MPLMDIKLEHRVVGALHVFTSPDLPGLYVAHADRETAERNIPEAVEMLRQMQARRLEKQHVRKLAALGA